MGKGNKIERLMLNIKRSAKRLEEHLYCDSKGAESGRLNKYIDDLESFIKKELMA